MIKCKINWQILWARIARLSMVVKFKLIRFLNYLESNHKKKRMLESTIILENQIYTGGRDEQTHSPWDEDVRAKIQVNLVGRSNNR